MSRSGRSVDVLASLSSLSSDEVSETSFEPFTPLGRTHHFALKQLEQFVTSRVEGIFKETKSLVKPTGLVETDRLVCVDP